MRDSIFDDFWRTPDAVAVAGLRMDGRRYEVDGRASRWTYGDEVTEMMARAEVLTGTEVMEG